MLDISIFQLGLSNEKFYIKILLVGETNFIDQLVNYDKDNIPDKTIMKISKYTSDPLLAPQEISKK